MTYIQKMKMIAKQYNLKLHFKKSMKDAGQYHPSKEKIVINKKYPEYLQAMIFCHELGHHFQKVRGTFKDGYNAPIGSALHKRYFLKIERHADKLGKELCADYFPELEYKGFY